MRTFSFPGKPLTRVQLSLHANTTWSTAFHVLNVFKCVFRYAFFTPKIFMFLKHFKHIAYYAIYNKTPSSICMKNACDQASPEVIFPFKNNRSLTCTIKSLLPQHCYFIFIFRDFITLYDK